MIELTHEALEEEHTHILLDDWHLGGPNSTDPRADSRWAPTTYEYYDGRAQRIHVTQVPLCDDEALDYFTTVAGWGKGFNPVWVSATRPDRSVQMLPFTYNKATDEIEER